MRGILRVFVSIVGGTIFFYTLFYLSLSLFERYRPEFKELLADKMNTLSAIMALVLFISLLATIALYCIIVRLVTGRWPIVYDVRSDIASIRRDISSLGATFNIAITEIRDSTTTIRDEIKKIDARLTKLEGQDERTKGQAKETRKGKRRDKK